MSGRDKMVLVVSRFAVLDAGHEEDRLKAVFFVIAPIGNLHYPNIRKCPVFSSCEAGLIE